MQSNKQKITLKNNTDKPDFWILPSSAQFNPTPTQLGLSLVLVNPANQPPTHPAYLYSTILIGDKGYTYNIDHKTNLLQLIYYDGN